MKLWKLSLRSSIYHWYFFGGGRVEGRMLCFLPGPGPLTEEEEERCKSSGIVRGAVKCFSCLGHCPLCLCIMVLAFMNE